MLNIPTTPAFVTRNMRGDLEAETDIALHPMPEPGKTRIIRVYTHKGSKGVTCTATVGIYEEARGSGFTGFQFALGIAGGGDFMKTIARSDKRATMAEVARVHAEGLRALADHEAAIRAQYPDPKPAEPEAPALVLTGSNRSADTAAAAGQLDLLAGMPRDTGAEMRAAFEAP